MEDQNVGVVETSDNLSLCEYLVNTGFDAKNSIHHCSFGLI